jgi:hypothetical protein
MPTNENEITITIQPRDDGIPTASFTTFLNYFTGILRSTAKQLAKESPETKWLITAISMRSPCQITLRGLCEQNTVLPRRVIRHSLNNIRQIEATTDMPEGMTDEDLHSVIGMVSVLNDGIDSIAIESLDCGKICPSQHIAANAQTIRRKYRHRFGSFRGRLEDISTHGGHHNFVIYDLITDQPIRCAFNQERYLEVGALLKKRVVVYGKAHYTPSGSVASIDVDDFRGLPAPDELPKISECPGIDLPPDFDSVQFIRNLRNAESV